MPKQIIRLLIAFVIFVGIFILVRKILVPDTFGDLGHYRAKSLQEIAALDTKFVGTEKCITCHGKIDTVKKAGVHANINCETCHGPGDKHVADPKTNKLQKPTERTDCGLCHSKNPSRPSNFHQVDLAKHNINKKCITCHNPHSPGFRKPKTDDAVTTPGNPENATDAGTKKIDASTCAVCHDDINKLRIGGVHKSVDCTSCHSKFEKHIDDPGSSKPTKSPTREFCGKCHGKGIASASGKIKQIDLKEHNTEANCVECHNPHSPWN